MKDSKIRKMLEELVMEVDYDIGKSMFVPECRESSDEDCEESIDRLVEIVRKYLPKEKKKK